MKYKLSESEMRTYKIEESCIFKKNNERYGGLSNMSTSFPLNLNGFKIKTTEALYQACRFPFNADIQTSILNETSPMKVKMISNSKKKYTREDWSEVRLKVMKWCLQVKLAQNFITFSETLFETENKFIVENSSSDNFWGAIPNKDKTVFVGKNALGRLLMELRQKLYSKQWVNCFYILPLEIPSFLLIGEKINVVDERLSFIQQLLNHWNSSQFKIEASESVLNAIDEINRHCQLSNSPFQNKLQPPLF